MTNKNRPLEERLSTLYASAYGERKPVSAILEALTDEQITNVFDDLLETCLQEGAEIDG